MVFVLMHLDWLTTSLGLTSMALLARRSRWGWVAGIANDAVWLVLAFDRGMYGTLAGAMVMIAVKMYGLRRWLPRSLSSHLRM